jgi:hypothetical protein
MGWVLNPTPHINLGTTALGEKQRRNRTSSFVISTYFPLFGHFLHRFPCLYFLQQSFFLAQE